MHLLPGDHHLAAQHNDKIVWSMQIRKNLPRGEKMGVEFQRKSKKLTFGGRRYTLAWRKNICHFGIIDLSEND